MPFDRVRETSTTTGVGSLTLAGAPTGFRAFADVYTPGAGSLIHYVIEGVTDAGAQTGEWEVGVGLLAGDGTLSRAASPIASSNGGALVDFASGTKRVYDAATVAAATALVTAGVAGHVAAVDPHLDRAYTDGSIEDHSVAADPHGDRAYAAGLVAAIPSTPPRGAVPLWGLPGLFVVGVAGVAAGLKTTVANAVYITPICAQEAITLTDLSVVIESGLPTVTFLLCEISGEAGGLPVITGITNLGSVVAAGAGRLTLTGLAVPLARSNHYALAIHVSAGGTIYSWVYSSPGLGTAIDAPASTTANRMRGLVSLGHASVPTAGPLAIAEYAAANTTGLGGFISHLTAKWTRP